MERLSMTMTFIMSIMSQICFLVAMLMMCSVSGRGIDNLREKARGERSIAESTGQENTVCGQKQIQTSKRNEEKGGLNNHDDSDHLDKILGGSDVIHGDIPWQASYYSNGRFICGAVIISEYWVLTTAICLLNRHNNPYVFVGDHRLSQSNDGLQIFRVRNTYGHGLFNDSAFDYDIALIKVEPKNGRGIRFNNYVQPICLPWPGEGPTDGDRLTVSGWGNDTIELDHTTDVLRKIVLTVMNHQECRSLLQPGVITDNMLCASIPPNSGVCLGDFGGPATYKIGDSHLLVGLIAMSTGCQSPTPPVVLTNILAHRDWINAVIYHYSNITENVIPRRSG